ncbi:hypothetical protein ACQR35_09950 [Pseudarthrobacter sp. J1738]|uniref:hypothetical protein n=1 Tax=Pseudarthrobacter sp. J1738 TaxID=3420446 RepID=UPI003D2A49B3
MSSNTAWTGTDASRFKSEWNSDHRKTLMAASRMLEEGAKNLRNNADEQDKSSASATGSTGPAGTVGKSAPDAKSPGQTLIDWAKAIAGVGFKIKDMVGLLKNPANLLSSKKILDVIGGLKNFKGFAIAEDFTKATGLIGKFGRFAGPALAPFAILGGIHDMFNPEHSGWRGGGDRIAGGLSVLGGVGSIAIAAGLLTNPVGIGIVVGAGLIAGGWALGNMIADSAWGKAAGKWIGNTASKAWNGATNAVSNAVSNTVDGAKKFLHNPVASLGGLLS